MNVPVAAPLETALTASGSPVWLRVGTLFAGDSSSALRDAHLVYDANRILHVGSGAPPRHLLPPDRWAPDVHLPSHTVLPGLIEGHAHLFLEGGEENPDRRADFLQLSAEEQQRRAEARLTRLLRIGVTAVRDAGDKHGVGLALQNRYRSAERGAMPYLDSPGAAIHRRGRYGSFMGRPVEEFESVETSLAARVADGAHRIKVLATGIINFEKGAVTTAPQFSATELSAIVAAARRLGRDTMIHCSGWDGVANCIEARVDTIEHGFFVDDTQLARMRDLDIAWVPTFAPVHFQLDRASELGWNESVRSHLWRILDAHARSLAHAIKIGVRIVAGSDAGSHGVPHGHGFLQELELMEYAGMSTAQVLHAATGASAARLGFAETFGRLRSDTKARFVVTAAPVLESVRHLRAPLTTVFDGQVFSGGDDPAAPGL